MSATSMKQIKNRIKSIRSTRQITHAMQLVASSRMKRMSKKIESAKPYFEVLTETLNKIAETNLDFSSPYTREKAGRVCHIVIAGDRGLAGGYNNNLFKSLSIDENSLIFPIGKKAAEYFSDYEILTDRYEKAAQIEYEDCQEIGREIAKAFHKGEFTSLYISYTSFKNMLSQQPETKRLLPIISDKVKEKPKIKGGLTIYDPNAEYVFEKIVPYYLSGMVYGAVTESVTSETAARRNAMEAATDNADEMLDSLTLEYNRARQASVTQELTEIVSGAENL